MPHNSTKFKSLGMFVRYLGQSLSVAMRASLAGDVIPSVLNAAHLTALDRRVRTIALLLYHCLQRDTTSDFRQVVVDDGF